MKGKTLTIALAAIMALSIAGAQTKPGGKAPAQKDPSRIVLGTNQMAGDNGKFGLTYTIGQQSPINFTLTDVKFSVTRFTIGNNSYAPGKDEKLLILTFWAHNPNPEITHFDGGSLKFTVVDQENENHEGTGQIARKDSGDLLSMDFKPAQKIQCQAVLIVPAKGTVPKLIVQHRSGGAVLRYDLRDALKPLEAPFAGQGMDALSEIKADKEQVLPLLYFDTKFISTEFIEKRFGPTTIPDDKVFFFPKFMIKKQVPGNYIVRLTAQAVTEDGDRYTSQAISKASVEEHAASYLEQGQEVNIRMMIIVPKKAKIKEVRLWEDNGKQSRTYIFPAEAQFEKPSAPQTESSKPSSSQQIAGVNADEYATVFKTAKGETAFEIAHTEFNNGKEKRSQIVAAGRTALLVEDLTSGATTLHFPDTKETYTAPKAQGKEPQTSLSYYEMAYANSAAPKKKKNVLGSIGSSILGNAASGLGQQLVSGAVLSGFGQASLPRVVNAGVQSQVNGYAVREFASQLGRAVLTSSTPSEAGGPERVHEQVAVDKSVYVETDFKGRKQVAAEAFAFDGSNAKAVDATSLFNEFSAFLSKSLK